MPDLVPLTALGRTYFFRKDGLHGGMFCGIIRRGRSLKSLKWTMPSTSPV